MDQEESDESSSVEELVEELSDGKIKMGAGLEGMHPREEVDGDEEGL